MVLTARPSPSGSGHREYVRPVPLAPDPQAVPRFDWWPKTLRPIARP